MAATLTFDVVGSRADSTRATVTLILTLEDAPELEYTVIFPATLALALALYAGSKLTMLCDRGDNSRVIG